MTAKELKKLSRAELLEMLLQQVEENDRLRQELDDVKAKLADRTIIHEQSGSIAEAALRVNSIFDLAQQAADDYLASIRLANAEPEAYTRQVQEEAQARADAIIAEAEQRSARIRAEADDYWQKMRAQVQSALETQ